MRRVDVKYHDEDGSYWAEADSVPGFSAAASTLEGLREQVAEGLAFFLDEPFVIIHSSVLQAAEPVTLSFGEQPSLRPVSAAAASSNAGWLAVPKMAPFHVTARRSGQATFA